MNKLTLLLLLPLAACGTPEQLAQLKADEAAQTAKEAQAESGCIDQGLGTHTQAFVWCVNKRLHADGLEIQRRDDGKIALLSLQSDPFPYEAAPATRSYGGPVPLASPRPSKGR